MNSFDTFICCYCPCINVKLNIIFIENDLYILIYTNYRDYFINELLLLDNLNLF